MIFDRRKSDKSENYGLRIMGGGDIAAGVQRGG
jgi:hypothetical protein